MNDKVNLRVQKIKLTVFLNLIFCAIFISCGQNSKKQPSELIKKINAVQQQVMVQGNITEEEERAMSSLCSIMSQDDGLAYYDSDNIMILKDVEIAPVYNGCENLSKEATKECFNNKVSTFIKQEFDLTISKGLNLSEPNQVDAFFIIDENGKLTGMKVRDSEVVIQAEILRVLRKIPMMKPAIHNRKKEAVLCSMIVTYGSDIEIEIVYIPNRPKD